MKMRSSAATIDGYYWVPSMSHDPPLRTSLNVEPEATAVSVAPSTRKSVTAMSLGGL